MRNRERESERGRERESERERESVDHECVFAFTDHPFIFCERFSQSNAAENK